MSDGRTPAAYTLSSRFGQVACGLIRSRKVSTLDAPPIANPLVGCVGHAFQPEIGKHSLPEEYGPYR
jgi:hypothetical protein